MNARLGLALALGVSFLLSPPGAGDTNAQESTAIVPPGPTTVQDLAEPAPFFPGQDYDPAISTPESILGFPVGHHAASHAEIERCVTQWSEESPRLTLGEHAVTYEGRTLYHLIITSEENHRNLARIKEDLGRLADPRGLADDEADRLVETLPAVAWMAYSIHGDEASGSDASLALIYHLAAARDSGVDDMLADLIVIVEPMMNPDGRDRFIKQNREHRGTSPNFDDQSLLHSLYWPWGRMNHYLFDLNRDWILGVNPEARGRIATVGSWHPLLFVDAHEMGPQDTYLFSPARDPSSPHYPESRDHWSTVFARDQAAAFDRHGWPYYHGEWNEGWYTGYSDAWATFRGAVGILYEQASMDEDAVRQANGHLFTYHEAVHHQLTSSMANLQTLQIHADELKRDFFEERRSAVSRGGTYADRTFAILPGGNHSRLAGFMDLMRLQGFEMWTTSKEIAVGPGKDRLGRSFTRRTLPPGTVLISNRQPEAHLVAAMFEFDHPMPDDYLKRERKALVKNGQSTIYDVTAWSLPMMHDVETLELAIDLPGGLTPYETPASPAPLTDAAGAVAYVIDGADDRSVVAAARLMERGVRVRVADRPLVLDGHSFARGSVVALEYDNRGTDLQPAEIVAETAEELGLGAVAVRSGLGDGEHIDLGGSHFVLLEPPRIGVVARGNVSGYDFGTIWHMLDQRFSIRHSHLNDNFFTQNDLRRYNVLILPDRWSGPPSSGALGALKTWVETGGTLIGIGSSASAIAAVESNIGHTRLLPDVLDRLDQFDLALTRELMARKEALPATESVWSYTAIPEETYPWDGAKKDPRPGKEELEKQDTWNRMFMPQGAFLAAQVDEEHWLTAGSGSYLPVLYGSSRVLMASDSVEAPVRMGYIHDDPAQKEARRVGWATIPDGQTMHLRMSGLLWPEGARRLAGAPWVTRESVGQGQVILFATSPNFRASTLGTARVLANAIIYGPGMGANTPIKP